MTHIHHHRTLKVEAMSRVIDRIMGPLRGEANRLLANNLAGWPKKARVELGEFAKLKSKPSSETWGMLVNHYRTRAERDCSAVVQGEIR